MKVTHQGKTNMGQALKIAAAKASRGSELAKLRMRCHCLIDGPWKFKIKSRDEVYAELAECPQLQPIDCHIGLFNEAQGLKLIQTYG